MCRRTPRQKAKEEEKKASKEKFGEACATMRAQKASQTKTDQPHSDPAHTSIPQRHQSLFK